MSFGCTWYFVACPDHDVLLTILQDQFGFQDTALKWFENYLHSRYFKVAIEDKYSKSKEFTFSIPKGSCSSANLFTCYWSLIDHQINNSITLSGFADDHSIHKNFKASNKNQEQQTKTVLEEAFKQIKCWDGHNVSQIKLWIYSFQIPSTTHEDITRTTLCPWQPYWNKQSSEVSGRISGPTQFQTAH